jgi:serine/threonine protein kinase
MKIEFPACKGKSLNKLLPGIHKDGVDFIQHMLQWSAEKRPSASTLLKHKYLKNVPDIDENESDSDEYDEEYLED